MKREFGMGLSDAFLVHGYKKNNNFNFELNMKIIIDVRVLCLKFH